MAQTSQNYNHNADIRSTQIADAGHSLAKATKELALGLYGCLLLLGIISGAGLFIHDLADKSRGIKTLNFSELSSDYSRNEVRAADT